MDTVTMETEARMERRRRQRESVVGCCKSAIAFIFSHVGLSATVAAYALAGGFLFQLIEGSHELWEMNKATANISRFKVTKVNVTLALALDLAAGRIKEAEFTSLVHAHFDDFQQLLRELVIDVTWDWRDAKDGDVNIKWSLASALLYSVTLITTIGYGHVAPRTTWGRLMTIVYAIVGIPLTFLYLSNIGNFFASCFRILYKRFCCEILCCQRCERQNKIRREHMRRLRKLQQLAISSLKTRALRNNYTSGPQVTSLSLPVTSFNGREEGELKTNGWINREDIDDGMEHSRTMLLPYDEGRPVSTRSHKDSAERLSLGLLDLPETDILLSESTDNLLTVDSLTDISHGDSFMCVMDMAKETDIVSAPNSPIASRKPVTWPATMIGDVTVTEYSVASTVRDVSTATYDVSNASNPPTITAVASIERRKSAEKENWQSAMLEIKPDQAADTASASLATVAAVPSNQGSKSQSSLLTIARSRSNTMDPTKAPNRNYRKVSRDSKTAFLSIPRKSNNHSTFSLSKLKTNHKHNKGQSKSVGRQTKSCNENLNTKSKSNLAVYTNDIREDTDNNDCTNKQLSVEKFSEKSQRKGKLLVRNNHVSNHRDAFGKRRSVSLTLCDVRDVQRLIGRRRSAESTDSYKQSRTSDLEPQTSTSKVKDYQAIVVDDDNVDPLMADYAKILADPSALLAEEGIGVDVMAGEELFEYEQHTTEESDHISVPISVCMLVMASYIFGGAILFSEWEGWDYLQGSYFCFITLATIGLGDLVPGMAMEKWQSNQKLVLCALWLAVGLSLIAMCFNLMQEEVKEKFRYLGHKLGLLKDDGQ